MGHMHLRHDSCFELRTAQVRPIEERPGEIGAGQ